MRRMSMIKMFPIERYRCPTCDREFTAHEVSDTWKCPDCADQPVFVYEDGPGKAVLTRKTARDVQVNDLIYLPGSLVGPYQVIAVQSNGTKVKIALRGHGTVSVDPGEPVNFREGMW